MILQKTLLYKVTKAEVKAGVKIVNGVTFQTASQGVEGYAIGLMSGALKEGIGVDTYNAARGTSSSMPNSFVTQPSDVTRVVLPVIDKLKKRP